MKKEWFTISIMVLLTVAITVVCLENQYYKSLFCKENYVLHTEDNNSFFIIPLRKDPKCCAFEYYFANRRIDKVDLNVSWKGRYK